MKQLQITATFANLTDAIAATGFDLSYNEPLARQDIKWTAKHISGVLQIGSDLYAIFNAENGIKLLNKYTPFCAAMDDRHLNPAYISADGNTLTILDNKQFSKHNRAALAKCCKLGTLFI